MLGVGVPPSMLGGLWVEGDRQSNLIKCIQFVCLSRIKLLGFACVRRTSNQCGGQNEDRQTNWIKCIPFVCLSVSTRYHPHHTLQLETFHATCNPAIISTFATTTNYPFFAPPPPPLVAPPCLLPPPLINPLFLPSNPALF
jgi:hypothetical protein